MKYIISEQRLERLVSKYLSSLRFTQENDDADGFDIMQSNNEVLQYRNEEMRLYISLELIRHMKELFGLSQKESMIYIKNWFQDEYNIQVDTLSSFIPQSPF